MNRDQVLYSAADTLMVASKLLIAVSVALKDQEMKTESDYLLTLAESLLNKIQEEKKEIFEKSIRIQEEILEGLDNE